MYRMTLLLIYQKYGKIVLAIYKNGVDLMLLLGKERLVEQRFDSNIIITAFEEDYSHEILDLMTEFNVLGLNYMFMGKGLNIENDFWYWKSAEENLQKANCLVIVLSPTVFLPENSKRREAFWYEVGVIEARGKRVIPYFIKMDKKDLGKFLEETPIRQMQATNNIDQVVEQIEQVRTFKKNYFLERNVALYGNSRVFYTKMSVLFTIKNEVIDKVYNRALALEEDDIQTKSDIIQLLQKEINFGVKLYRFGKECFINHPYYCSYVDEAKILNIDCNSINEDNRFMILSQNPSSGVTIKVDFIIPNHEIFGAAIKPYMEVSRNSIINKDDLKYFLECDLDGNGYLDKVAISDTFLNLPESETSKNKSRIYFNLYFGEDVFLIKFLDGEEEKTCNYIYAK